MIKDLICTNMSVQFEKGKAVKDINFNVYLRKEPNKFKIELNFVDPTDETSEEQVWKELRKIFKFDE